MLLRRLLLAALVLYCAANLLLGCAAGEYREGWQEGNTWKRARQPLPYVWTEVQQSEIPRLCKSRAGFTTFACAIYRGTYCEIVAETAESETPAWLVRHEKRHCEGWNHE